MVEYVKPRPGYKFVISAYGAEQPHIRAKFKKDNVLYESYKHSVPKVWLDKGYVTQVEDIEEKEVQLKLTD